MSDDTSSTIADAVDRFVHGAKTYLAGCYLDVQALVNKGSAIVRQATGTIDTISPTGRAPLIPLLDHDDE